MDPAQGQELYRMIMARHYLKSAVKLGSYILSHERDLAKGIKKKLERTVILYYSIPFRHTCSWGALSGEFIPTSELHGELLAASEKILGAKDTPINFFREKDQNEIYCYNLSQPSVCGGKISASVVSLARPLQEKIEERINSLGDQVDFNRASDEVEIHLDGTISSK